MSTSPYAELIAECAAAAAARRTPLVIGLSGPQGSGKSTLAREWQTRWQALGLRAVAIALDDFYLTRAERVALSERVHPLLLTRGVPGTHDVALAIDTLAALSRPGSVVLPSFDKALDDRRPVPAWQRITTPVQIVVFEGWCVGAVPQTEAQLATPVNDLERAEDSDSRWRRYVNQQLAGQYQTLFSTLDKLVLLRPPDFDIVFEWRREQELALRRENAAGSGVMDDAQLRRFIEHYERLTRHMLEEMPQRADVVIELDARRHGRIKATGLSHVSGEGPLSSA